jgi:hypothetical protein
MERDQIINCAKLLNAEEFISILHIENVSFDILDQDDLMDVNNGNCNIEVEGLQEGEALLFFNGRLAR